MLLTVGKWNAKGISIGLYSTGNRNEAGEWFMQNAKTAFIDNIVLIINTNKNDAYIHRHHKMEFPEINLKILLVQGGGNIY